MHPEGDASLRAFVAAHFEKNDMLAGIINRLSADGRIRTVPENQRHVTLLFFKDIDGSEVQGVCDALKSIRMAKFSSTSAGVTGFPYPKRSRVVVLLLDSPELKEIHSHVVQGAPGKFDRKDFRAHITLARSRNRPADAGDYEKLGHGIEIKFTDVALVKSELTPQGPVYTEICSVQLM